MIPTFIIHAVILSVDVLVIHAGIVQVDELETHAGIFVLEAPIHMSGQQGTTTGECTGPLVLATTYNKNEKK